jgi:hypothetical protein
MKIPLEKGDEGLRDHENPFGPRPFNRSSLICVEYWFPFMITKAFTPEKGVEPFVIMKTSLLSGEGGRRVLGGAWESGLAYCLLLTAYC